MRNLFAMGVVGGLALLSAGGGCTSAVAVANNLPYAVSVSGRVHTSSALAAVPLSSDAPHDAETVELGDVVVPAGGSGSLPRPAVTGPFRRGTVSLTLTPVVDAVGADGKKPEWRSCSVWLTSAPSQVVFTIRAFEPGSEVLTVDAREGFGAQIETVGVRWDPPYPTAKPVSK